MSGRLSTLVDANGNPLPLLVGKAEDLPLTLERYKRDYEAELGKLTFLSDAAILNLKFVFLPLWVERNTEIRIGMALGRTGFFETNYGNVKTHHCYDEESIDEFDAFLAWHIVSFAQQNGFNIIEL